MHNQGKTSIITSKETEWLAGELEINHQRNTVEFHPKALCELTFSLPLTPSEIDAVRTLTQIGRRLQTHNVGTHIGNDAGAREPRSNN